MEEHFFTLLRKGTSEEHLCLCLDNGDFIRVENHEVVIQAIDKNSYPNSLQVNVFQVLKCKVDIRPFTEEGIPLPKNGGYKNHGETEPRKPILKAFVSLPEICQNCNGTGEVFIYKK